MVCGTLFVDAPFILRLSEGKHKELKGLQQRESPEAAPTCPSVDDSPFSNDWSKWGL